MARRYAPRRWQFAGSKNHGGSTSIRGRVRSLHVSGGRRWLSCRQPSCLYSRQLRRGTDRQTDGRVTVYWPPTHRACRELLASRKALICCARTSHQVYRRVVACGRRPYRHATLLYGLAIVYNKEKRRSVFFNVVVS